MLYYLYTIELAVVKTKQKNNDILFNENYIYILLIQHPLYSYFIIIIVLWKANGVNGGSKKRILYTSTVFNVCYNIAYNVLKINNRTRFRIIIAAASVQRGNSL